MSPHTQWLGSQLKPTGFSYEKRRGAGELSAQPLRPARGGRTADGSSFDTKRRGYSCGNNQEVISSF